VTSTVATVAPRPASRRRVDVPRWDQELRHAKNSGKPIRVQLAVETYFADEDCSVSGFVLDIDRNGIKVETTKGTFWCARAFIVGTEMLDD
jgi:hypothetical protein